MVPFGSRPEEYDHVRLHLFSDRAGDFHLSNQPRVFADHDQDLVIRLERLLHELAEVELAGATRPHPYPASLRPERIRRRLARSDAAVPGRAGPGAYGTTTRIRTRTRAGNSSGGPSLGQLTGIAAHSVLAGLMALLMAAAAGRDAPGLDATPEPTVQPA